MSKIDTTVIEQKILSDVLPVTPAEIFSAGSIHTIYSIKNAKAILERTQKTLDTLLEQAQIQAVCSTNCLADCEILFPVVSYKYQQVLLKKMQKYIQVEIRLRKTPKEAIVLAAKFYVQTEHKIQVLLRGAQTCRDFKSCYLYTNELKRVRPDLVEVRDFVLKKALNFSYTHQNCMWVHATTHSQSLKESAIQRAVRYVSNLKKLQQLHELSLTQESKQCVAEKFKALCITRLKSLKHEGNIDSALYLYQVSKALNTHVTEVEQVLSEIVETSLQANLKTVATLLKLMVKIPKEITALKTLSLYILQRTKNKRSIQKIRKLSSHIPNVVTVCDEKLQSL